MEGQAELLWGVVFSAIGLGYFVYGKKQRRSVPLMVGVALMLYTYFIPNLMAMVLIGLVLTAIPFFIRQ